MPDTRHLHLHYIPRVLKLARHKFACYVELHSAQSSAPLLVSDTVKIVARRKYAWRVAAAMARRISK